MTAEPMNAEQVEACRVHILRELSYGEPGRLGADESLAMIAGYQERLALGDVDHFLRRERDEYEPRGECWNTVNDVLDALRLHVITGTPLTAPRPEGGPEAFGVGKEPLTEAEELRAEVARLRLKVGEYENTLNSFTTCTECAGHLDREHTAEWRAAQAEAERDRLLAELATVRELAEPMDDGLRLATSCVECMDRPASPGSDFCPDCKGLFAAESSSPTEEKG